MVNMGLNSPVSTRMGLFNQDREYVKYVWIKDHIEKIDFQDIFIAVVNWPISEFYRAFVCTMR